jgi:hypothetical protein
MADILSDILISELPRIDTFSYDDLLVIDKKFGSTYETYAITWGNLLGIPDGGNGGGGGLPGGDLILNLNRITRFPDGTEQVPSISFINDPDTGFYRPGTNTIGFTAGGHNAMVIKHSNKSSGYVGIGTVVPDEKLHVKEGNLKLELGIDNVMMIGASGANLGGDPSIRVINKFPLIFHTDDTERFRISEFGAFGLPGSPNLFGQDKQVITSRGDNTTPIWRHINDLLDWQVIGDFLQTLVGTAEIRLLPIDWVSSDPPGIAINVIREQPTANTFGDPVGWNIKVDSTVVRTFGDQRIDGNKTLAPTGGLNFSELPTLP